MKIKEWTHTKQHLAEKRRNSPLTTHRYSISIDSPRILQGNSWQISTALTLDPQQAGAAAGFFWAPTVGIVGGFISKDMLSQDIAGRWFEHGWTHLRKETYNSGCLQKGRSKSTKRVVGNGVFFCFWARYSEIGSVWKKLALQNLGPCFFLSNWN